MSTPEFVAVKRLFQKRATEEFMPALRNRPKEAVYLFPASSPANQFPSLFARAISDQGYLVRDFDWNLPCLWKANVIFLHWPDEFFVYKGKLASARLLIKLAVMQIAKVLGGPKFIWIAHNAAPHDTANSVPFIRRWFLQSLGGVIFLSEYSRALINRLYPEVGKCNALVTVHSHYRNAAVTRETPVTTPIGNIKLVHFGLIRPYKNVEALVGAASSMSSGIDLLVAGKVTDRELSATIRASAQLSPHIRLDLREVSITDAELEAIVDAADAVVLPYKNILNSGAALFSLSRNRPVLAPNMGSLPELRATVGHEWVYLYDGEFNQHVLADFREWILRTKRASVAPLEAYELSRIGNDLRGFIETMNSQKVAVAS
jgi:beta-1,4-mannosyltransferase